MGRKEAEAKKLHRELSNTVDVYFSGKYTEKELTKIAHRLEQGISETEWANLRDRYKLPDEGREFIDHLTATYWDWRIDHSVAKGLGPKVEQARAQAQRLADSLPKLLNDRDFFKGVYAYYNLSPSEQAQFLEKTVAQLHSLDRLLSDAIKRIAEPAHRPSHRAIWHTLRILSNLLAALGRPLDDSPESIAYPIILGADPKVTKAMLTSVLKEFVATWPILLQKSVERCCEA